MDPIRVSAKIYGREYTIVGGTSREHILKVADYVDSKMHTIAQNVNTDVQDVAVLTAVNAADDYFGLFDENESLKYANEQLKREAEHFNTLWEEAKRSYSQYKDESEAMQVKLTQMNEELANRDKSIADLKLMAKGLEAKLIEEASRKSEAVDDRVKELESACFDLEMENVKVKAELERLKKRL